MSGSNGVQTHFTSGAETPELEEYRPISPLVIAACVAGLASLLALIHPLLWVVPVIAVVLSAGAIVRVSAAHSRYGGRRGAIIALCIAALVGAYAPSRAISRDRAICREARSKAEAWMSLVQEGRLQEAHQLSLNADDRFQGPASLASYYADVPPDSSHSSAAAEMGLEAAGPSPAQMLNEFMAMPAVAKLTEFGEQARIEHLGDVTIALQYGDMRITQRYRVSRVDAEQSESSEFLVRATRREVENVANWKVGELELVK